MIRKRSFWVKVVFKHEVIFVAAAGNAGPALTTAGAPGATSEAIFGIGAFVEGGMMRTCYSMPTAATSDYSTNFTWTSVGPSADGGAGPQVVAPGGAITCVPNWTLAGSQLMNGTSMASPNACGNIALLLSGLKAEGVKYTPHRVQRAVTNTAVIQPGVFSRAQGSGLLQVDAAYAYILEHTRAVSEDVRFKVTVGGAGPGRKRGVYIRDACDSAQPTVHQVTVEPKLHEDGPKAKLVDFELRFSLESDCYWIAAPEQHLCTSQARSFKITVDPTVLEPGVHCGHVVGRIVGAREQKQLFSVPVTVVKPTPCPAGGTLQKTIDLSRGAEHRLFVTPPPGSTWMDISVSVEELNPASDTPILVLHTVQMHPHRRHIDSETKNYLRLRPSQHDTISRKVDGENTVEICLAAYWSTLATARAELEVTFHGIRPSDRTLCLNGGAGHTRTLLEATVRDVVVSPSGNCSSPECRSWWGCIAFSKLCFMFVFCAPHWFGGCVFLHPLFLGSLTTWQTPVRPTTQKISPLPTQYDWPEGKRIHQLCLNYTLTLDEAAEITLRQPLLNSIVYESEVLGGPFAFVFDDRKKLLGFSDVFPDPIKAPKGKITIRAFLRHPSTEFLDRHKDLLLLIDRKLEKPVALDAYVYQSQPQFFSPRASLTHLV